MKDRLIKLHDDFVSKGMKRSAFLNIMSLAISDRKSLRIITDKEIGYVLLDMQTWLREEHNVYFMITPVTFRGVIVYYNVEVAIPNMVWDKPVESKNHKTYEEALETGLQEGLKLIKYMKWKIN